MLARGLSQQLGTVLFDCWDWCTNLAIVVTLKRSKVSTCRIWMGNDSSPLSLGSEHCAWPRYGYGLLSRAVKLLCFSSGKRDVLCFSVVTSDWLTVCWLIPAAEVASLLSVTASLWLLVISCWTSWCFGFSKDRFFFSQSLIIRSLKDVYFVSILYSLHSAFL